MAESEAHRSFRIEMSGAQLCAVCECGWRSDASISAGMAGALWDKHREDVVGTS